MNVLVRKSCAALLLLVVLVASGSLVAQGTVVNIGAPPLVGSPGGNSFPMNYVTGSFYHVWPASQFSSTTNPASPSTSMYGEIVGFGWQYTTSFTKTWPNVKFWFGESTLQSGTMNSNFMANFNAGNPPLLAYDGPMTITGYTALGFMRVPMQNFYYYSGNNNLGIYVEITGGSSNPSSTVASYSSTSNLNARIYNSSSITPTGTIGNNYGHGGSFEFQQEFQWSGQSGNNWSTAANWRGGVPNATRNTIIDSSATWAVPTNVPNLATNSEVLGLTVKTGGSLNGTTSGVLTVRERLTIQSGGTFVPVNSTIIMDSTTPPPLPLELDMGASNIYSLSIMDNTVALSPLNFSAGGTLTVAAGATLTVRAGANFSALGNVVNNGTIVFEATGAGSLTMPALHNMGIVRFSVPGAADTFTVNGAFNAATFTCVGTGTVTFASAVTCTDDLVLSGSLTYQFQSTLDCNRLVIQDSCNVTVVGLASAPFGLLIVQGSTANVNLQSGFAGVPIILQGNGTVNIGGGFNDPGADINLSGTGSNTIGGDLTVNNLSVGGAFNLTVVGNLTVASYSQSTTGSVSVGGDAVVNGSMDMFSSGGLAIGGDLLLRGDIIDTATGAFTVSGSVVLNGTSAQNLNVAVHTLAAGSIEVQNPAGVILKGNYSASAALAVRVAQGASLRLDPGVNIRVGTTGTSGTVQVDGTLITITTGGTAPRLFGNAGNNEQGRLVVAATATANIDGLTLENFGPSSAPYAVELRGGSSVATFNGVSVSGSASTVAAILLDTTTFPRNVLGLSVTGTSPGNIDATTMPEFVPGLANVKLVISISKGVTTTVPDIYGIAHEIDPENVLSWENAPQLTIVTLSIPGATATVPYTASLSAIGGNQPVTWGLAVAPSWLSINPVTGELSGLPDLPHVGSSTVTVTASDTSLPPGIATKSFTLLVQSLVTVPLTITTSSLTVALEGIAYGYTLTAAGGSGAYVWSVVSPAVLPPGLFFNGLTGEISGTPADGSAQRAVVTFRVTDNGGQGQSTERTLNLDIVGPLNDPDARDRLLNNPDDGGACSLPGRGSGLPWAVLALLGMAALACTVRRGMAHRP